MSLEDLVPSFWGDSVATAEDVPLLERSAATTVRFEILGLPEVALDLMESAEEAKPQLHGADVTLRFVDWFDEIFKENLLALDEGLPEILGWMVLAAWLDDKTAIHEACQWVESRNPRGYRRTSRLYAAKVRRLLRTFMRGMEPTRMWHERDLPLNHLWKMHVYGEEMSFDLASETSMVDFLFSIVQLAVGAPNPGGTLQLIREEGHCYLDLAFGLR